MGKFINHDTEMVCFIQSRIEGRWHYEMQSVVIGWLCFRMAFWYGVLGTRAKSQNATNLLMPVVE